MTLSVGNKTKKIILFFAKIINSLFSGFIDIKVETKND